MPLCFVATIFCAQMCSFMRQHYRFDYQKAKPNRFASWVGEETIAVVLDPDVAAVFATSEEVNQALRVLIVALGNLAQAPDLLDQAKHNPVQSCPS